MSSEKKEGFLSKVAKAVKRRLPRTHTLLVFTGPPDINYDGALKAKGFDLAEMTPENVDEALSFRKREVVVQLRSYLRKGYRGWFAKLGEEIVGYMFMAAVTDKPRVVRRLKLHPGEAGAILVYARPQYRVFGVGPAMIREAMAKAAVIDGIGTFVMWTIPSHRRWFDTLKAFRMKPAGKVWILELFGRPMIRWTTGSKLKR